MICIIVACDEDGLIGKKDSENGMPWVNKEDLKHFKQTTIHHSVVFGMNTFKAMGRALPKRHTIVMTHQDIKIENIEVRHDLKEVIDEYRQRGEDLFICGGANIYAQALPLSDELWLSRIEGKHQGETYFPDFSSFDYRLKEKKPFETFVLEKYMRG